MAFAGIAPNPYPNDRNRLLIYIVPMNFGYEFESLMLHDHCEGFQLLLRVFHYLRFSVSNHASVIIVQKKTL